MLQKVLLCLFPVDFPQKGATLWISRPRLSPCILDLSFMSGFFPQRSIFELYPCVVSTHLYFLFTAEQHSFAWNRHSLIVHFLAGGYLGCFQFLSVVNRATVDIYIHAFWWMLSPCLSGLYLGARMLGIICMVCSLGSLTSAPCCPSNSPAAQRGNVIIPFRRGGSWGRERLSGLFEVTWLVRGWVGT